MTNKTISQLPDVGLIADDDYFVVVDTSEENPEQRTKKVSFGEMQEQIELEVVAETIQQLVDDFASKAFKDSPALEGIPTAPTPAPLNNSTQLATTSYVDQADSLKAPIASPTFTGAPQAPTQTFGNDTTRLATTAFVQAAVAPKAPLSSPVFTGVPTAPTPAVNDDTTKLATTEFVKRAVGDSATSNATPSATNLVEGKIKLTGDLGGTSSAPTVPELVTKAPINSPALTGTPTAPTPALADNTTKIATTAFVKAAVDGVPEYVPTDASTLVKGVVKLAGDLGGTADLPTVPELASKAPLASPIFTGNPEAPTQIQSDDSNKIATTSFVKSAVAIQPSFSMAALDVDWLAGEVFKKDIAVDSTLSFSNPVDGKTIKVIVKNTDAVNPVAVEFDVILYIDAAVTIPASGVAVMDIVFDGIDYFVSNVALLQPQ